jgi:hypothetical protein
MFPTGAAIKPAIEQETAPAIEAETVAGNTIHNTVVALLTPTNPLQTNMAARPAEIPWAAVRPMLDKTRLVVEARQDRRTAVVAVADRKREAWIAVVAAPAIGAAADQVVWAQAEVATESAIEVQVRGHHQEAVERLAEVDRPEVRRAQVARVAPPVWDLAAAGLAAVAGAGGNP